ncbi:hypothetical protein ACIBG0_38930 [Nocardia sp. NPDC050630]|uniref:hypothetical protein n=1 Tax=Nocardia sp. NPDC050630 TaxID=3364321 RepID=UPI0037B70B7C
MACDPGQPVKAARKALAGKLLGLNRAIYKLACRIYPPQVTETPVWQLEWEAKWRNAWAEAERRESRGYEDPDPMARAYEEISAMFRKIRDEGHG